MNLRSQTRQPAIIRDRIRYSARLSVLVNALAPLLVLYGLYTIIRWSVIDRAALVGDYNAHKILDLERKLNIDWEVSLQSHLLPHNWLVWLVNHYYVYAFFPVLVLSAVVSALRAPSAFRLWRNVFAISLAVALIGFAIFPLTPPRLLNGGPVFVDTLLTHGPQYYGDESGASLFNLYGSIPSLVNEYAAMPSMHVGWSALAGVLLLTAFPGRRWLIVLATLHVIAMQFAVVATGNHYVIDGVVGLAVIAISYQIARRLTMTSSTQANPCSPSHAYCAGD